MSHQVLARKWRPRDFPSLVGQEHVVRALTHALRTGRLHHAYLFTGTRGVGKTTIARILSKSLNCETGVSDQACGQCRACREIDEGRFPDYLELDAASNRGVDEMVQLLDNAVYAPVSGRYKVYVIDEVHMLSSHAFNAMLKTLEEPPDHVIFILATTDPQKVPVTVLSRCLQFNLKNMPPAAVARHLARVMDAEGIEAEAPALALIGRAAAGSMRDALSLLDQAIAFSAGQVGEAAVREMLGVVDRRYLSSVLDALIAGDGAALLAVADDMLSSNAPFGRTLSDLATMLQRIAFAQVGAFGEDEDRESLMRYAAAILPEDLQVWYQIAIHGARDLALAPDEHAGFSMTLLRLMAFRPRALPMSGGEAVQPMRSALPQRPVSAGVAPRATGVPTAPAPSADSGEVGGAGLGPSRDAAVAAGSSSSTGHAGLEAARQALGNRGSAAARAPRSVAVGPRQTGDRSPTVVEPAPAPVGSPPAPPAPSASGPPPWVTDDPPDDWASPERETDAARSAHVVSGIPASGREAASVAVISAPEPKLELEPGPAAPPAQEASLPTNAPPPTSLMTSASTGLAGFDGDWPALAARLPLTGLPQQFMAQSMLLGVDGLVLQVRVPVRPLAEPGLVAKVRDALAAHFGVPVRLDVEFGAVEGRTAAVVASEQRAALMARTRAALEADPFVQSLLTDFGGRILPDSVKPAES